MSRHPKAPPRFIPTLTEVVPLPREPVVPPPPPPPPTSRERPVSRERPAAVASPAPAGPPPWLLDIPTLADSIEASFAAQTAPTQPHSAAEPFQQATALPGSLSAEQEARLVQRLLQRVEASLEHRLREAIDHIVQEQAALIFPKLRTEVRTLVRQTVGEAVAQEWINVRTPGRQEPPPSLSGAFARPLD